MKPSQSTSKLELFAARPNLTVTRFVAGAPAGDAAAATEVAEGEQRVTLKGYPIVWGALSDDRGGYRVRVQPGAITFTDPCFALYHHDFRDLIGNTQNGSLRILPADDYGVPVEIDLPDTTVGRDVGELVEDQYVSGMSWTLSAGYEFDTEETDAGDLIVTVTRGSCPEVTVTANPAFTATSVVVAGADAPESADTPPEESPAPTKERDAQSLKLHEYRLRHHGL